MSDQNLSTSNKLRLASEQNRASGKVADTINQYKRRANDRTKAIFQRIVYAKNSERANLNAKANDLSHKKYYEGEKNLSMPS